VHRNEYGGNPNRPAAGVPYHWLVLVAAAVTVNKKQKKLYHDVFYISSSGWLLMVDESRDTEWAQEIFESSGTALGNFEKDHMKLTSLWAEMISPPYCIQRERENDKNPQRG
jgi:hypothetical protein